MQKSPLLRLHFIVFLWGFTAILGKLISIGALGLVFYRMLFASVFLFIFIGFIKKERFIIPRNVLWKLVGTGLLIALHWLCFFQSIKTSNISIALCCLSLSTLFAAFLEPLFFRRKIDFFEILMGIIIVCCLGLILQVEFSYKEGIFFGVLASFLSALFSMFNGKLFGRVASHHIMFYEIGFGAIAVGLFLVATGQTEVFGNLPLADLGWILLLASVFTAFPMVESVKLLQYVSPFTMLLTINLEPIYGIFFAFLLFGESEKMSPIFYGASFVMILLIFINAWKKSKRKKIS